MGRGDDEKKITQAPPRRRNPFRQNILDTKDLDDLEKEEPGESKEALQTKPRSWPGTTRKEIRKAISSVYKISGDFSNFNNPPLTEEERDRIVKSRDRLQVLLKNIKDDPASLYSEEQIEKLVQKQLKKESEGMAEMQDLGYSKKEIKTRLKEDGYHGITSYDLISENLKEDIEDLEEALEDSKDLLSRVEAGLQEREGRVRICREALEKPPRTSAGNVLREILENAPDETLKQIDERVAMDLRGYVNHFPSYGLDQVLEYENRGLEVIVEARQLNNGAVIALVDPRTWRQGQGWSTRKTSHNSYLILVLRNGKIANIENGRLEHKHTPADFFARNRDDDSNDWQTLKSFRKNGKAIITEKVNNLLEWS